MAFATALVILALPWTYALVQRPRRPFIYGAFVGGTLGAVIMGVVVGEIDFLCVEFSLARSAVAALLMGGPLGSLLGQAVVALFVAPRPRRIGALLGWLIGPVLGWPLLYLFPAHDPQMWHGPYWLVFWLGSWAGWGALNGAYLGVWSQTWDALGKRVGKVVLAIMVLPAVAVGAWNMDAILLHISRVEDLARRRDVAAVVWKMDHGEELAQAVECAGAAAEGMDPAIEARLQSVLAGTFPPMVGQMRSDAEYRAARVSAAQSLGRIGDSGSIGVLLEYVTDADPRVRQAVVLALAGCPEARAREAVRKAAQSDPDEAIRAAARDAMSKGG